MISYKDDPNLDVKTVTTFDGQLEYRDNCRKIKSEYFVIDKDCFEVDGAWFRVNSGMIIFDYTRKKWVKKSEVSSMAKGIVDFDEKKEPVIGFFTPDKTNYVKVSDANTGEENVCMSEEVALKGCVEDKSLGIYYRNANVGVLKNCSKIRNAIDHKSKGYNIEDNPDEFIEKKAVFEKLLVPLNKKVVRYANLLGDISFGAEMECIKGFLPEHIQYKTGTILCRDGSLHAEDGTQGPEFTTIPMKGAKGVQTLITLGKELSKRTIVNNRCAYHLHIGNLPTSKVFLISLYKLCYLIQEELFQMFPPYKMDEQKFAGKDKNYCKMLEDLFVFSLPEGSTKEQYEEYIDDKYTRIFIFLSGDVAPSVDYNRKNGVHPRAQHKWEMKSRYYWVNLMNAIFGKRNTIEFRLHHGTVNPQKMVTWLFICNAIVKFAMQNSGDILKGKEFRLNDVLRYYEKLSTLSGNKMYEYLSYYVDSRTKYFSQQKAGNDFLVEAEFKNDANFYMDFPRVTEMFK